MHNTPLQNSPSVLWHCVWVMGRTSGNKNTTLHCKTMAVPFLPKDKQKVRCMVDTHTHTHLVTLFSGTTQVSRYQKGKTNLDFTEAREWMAVASAGLYANLHLAPDRKPHQHPTTLFCTDWMPFLPPNQQCQSTEGLLTFDSQFMHWYIHTQKITLS